MCWTIRTGTGNPFFRPASTSWSAGGPPVEAPITISLTFPFVLPISESTALAVSVIETALLLGGAYLDDSFHLGTNGVGLAQHPGIFSVVWGDFWPAPGYEDTELGVLMEPEVRHGAAEVYAGVQA